MKILTCIIATFLTILFYHGKAQSIGLGYHSTHTGRNLAATFNKTLKKHSFYLGPKYHINRTPVDNQNHVFYKRFQASNFKEHMGLVFGYQFFIGRPDRRFNPLVFADFQYLNAKIRRYGFSFTLLPMGGTKGLQKIDEYIDTTSAWENSLGIGYRVRLADQLYLIERFGLNFNVFTNLDRKFFLAKSKSEFGLLFSASVIHDF